MTSPHIFNLKCGSTHPSQTGHMLQAEAFYNYLEANAPELLGAVNPNNAAIAKQFGNQGGE